MTGKRDIHGKKIRHKRKKDATRETDADDADKNAAEMRKKETTSEADADDADKNAAKGARDILGKQKKHKKDATSTDNMDDAEITLRQRQQMQATLSSSSLLTPHLVRAWQEAEYEAFVDPYRGMVEAGKQRKKDTTSTVNADDVDTDKQRKKETTSMTDVVDAVQQRKIDTTSATDVVDADINRKKDATSATDMVDADKSINERTNVLRVSEPSDGKDNDQEPGDAGDGKDAGVTTVGDDAGGISQFGNFSDLDKFPRNVANETSNDAKDADVTTKADDGGGSGNDSTQEKKKVSQSGNFSKQEQFPRRTVTH